MRARADRLVGVVVLAELGITGLTTPAPRAEVSRGVTESNWVAEVVDMA